MSALTNVKHSADRGPAASRAAPSRAVLVIAGLLVAGAAIGLYIAALAIYPRISMLKGFDLGVYRMGGWLALHDPSRLYSWQLQPGVQFTYPPFAALVMTPLALVSRAHAMDAAVVLSTFAFAATIWIAWRELGARGATRLAATLLVAGLAFWFQPVQRTLFLGQIELVLMGLVVWDMSQPDERRWKGVMTGLAAGIKLTPLIFIAYLLITRRVRQAAVAAGAFVASVLISFAALPHESVKYWLDGYFLKAGRTGFVGRSNNQSLLGIITRFAGSAHAGNPPWIAAAIVTGVLGLVAGALLHRAGRRFEGLMTCALTALLISPISWDAHWVWIAPGLAVLVAVASTARRMWARLAWAGAIAGVLVAFGAWPRFWVNGSGPLPVGFIWWAPTTPFGYGDNPAFVEYHWHGAQLLVGNLYVLIGCALLLLAVAPAARVLPELHTAAWRARPQRRAVTTR